MKKLALWAARYGSPYPLACGIVSRFNVGFVFAVFALAFVTWLSAPVVAFAQHGAPAADNSIFALYGPACGVIAALVILFERLAKVIPNSTDNSILKGLLIVSSVLGVKVPDNK